MNGVGWLVHDPSTVVGRTPYTVIHRDGKVVVRRYRNVFRKRRRHALPVLLVPPLMVKPFIFDLFHRRSLVEFLLARGFRVYLIDFGDAPDSYGTSVAANGARHADPGISHNPRLGGLLDYETVAPAALDGTGDDVAGDDEDGVTLPQLVAAAPAAIAVDVQQKIDSLSEQLANLRGYL